ncbi:hypothetical protein GCM10029992_46780 [Glycomyces albus]
MMLSFSSVLLAVPFLVVAVMRRRWAVIAGGGAIAAAVVLAPLLWGYWWLDGMSATRERYYAGVASVRGYWYFLLGNLAIFALALGPAIAAALASLRERALWIVVGSTLAAVAIADVSGMSSSEVERIWQPFMPLVLLAGCALVRTRAWLSLQLAVPLILTVTLRVPWRGVPMRVLVTGGAGFIGGHVVERLAARGDEVVVLDSLAVQDDPPDYLPSGVDLRVADLADDRALAEAVEGVDAVCHQAARVGLGVDFDDVGGYVADNDLGTAKLLRALWRRSFSGRIVVASSMVVYGEGRYRCPIHGDARARPRTEPDLAAGRFEPLCPKCGADLEWATVTEDAPMDPRNVYAATKVHTEHLAFLFARETGSTVCALRYHNVYGPRMPRDTPMPGSPVSSAAPANPVGPRACSRTGGRCATSCTSAMSRAPMCSPSTRPGRAPPTSPAAVPTASATWRRPSPPPTTARWSRS